jgi:peptide subunit release factor 1 (eRF1)
MLVSTDRLLTRQKTLSLLDELDANESQATSLYLPHNLPPTEVDKALRAPLGSDILDILKVLPDITEAIVSSRTGAVLLWGEQGKYLVVPPFPVKVKLFASGCDVEPLRLLLQQERMIALILLRLGAYAIGVFHSEKLLSSKVGTGLVHSRHRQGGSSAHRFERHREKQIEYFFDRVCDHAREHLEPHLRQLDYVVYGGERHTLLSFRKQCEFTQKLDDRVLESRLNVREPKQATLEEAISQVWSSTVIQWQDTDGMEAELQ